MARSPEERSPTGQGSGVLAVRLHDDGLKVEEIETPSADPGEVLVRVHAAAITRDELEWPVDRLPAIPSYELSGVVVGSGDEVYALTPFDRDGVAAEYAVVPADGRADRLASIVCARAARPRRAGAGHGRLGRGWAHRRPACATRRRSGRGERSGRSGLRHSWRRGPRGRAGGHDRRGDAGRDLLHRRTRPRATAGVENARGRRRASRGGRLGFSAHGRPGGVRASRGPREAWQGRARGWHCLAGGCGRDLMRAAGVTALGGAVEIFEGDEPGPPAAGEVLIDVVAAGIGNWDELVRIGSWQIGGPAPMALGTEAAGTVAAAGSGVAELREGDEVMTHPLPLRRHGTWAGRVLAPAATIAIRPPEASWEAGGAFPIPALTAAQALDEALRIESGGWGRVNRAGGVTGGLLVQLPSAPGAPGIAPPRPKKGRRTP